MVTSTKKSSERDAMLLNFDSNNMEVYRSVRFSKRLEGLLNRKSKEKICLYLCIGFILSIVFAVIAFALTEIVLFTFEKYENTNGIKATKSCEKRIVGYYNLGTKFDLRDEQIQYLTHVIFYPLHVGINGTIYFNNDKEKKTFERSVKMTRENVKRKVKVMISIEDRDWGSDIFSTEKGKSLANSITQFIREYHLDGIDINWRLAKTKEQYLKIGKLCEELRGNFNHHSQLTRRSDSFLISLVAGWSNYRFLQDYIFNYIDFINVETHNYYGQWLPDGHLVGPVSPIESGHPNSTKPNLDITMKQFTCKTMKPEKLNIMVTFIGRFWNNVIVLKNSSETVWMTAERKDGKIEGGGWSWRHLMHIGWNASSASWNPESSTSYSWDPKERTYLSLETERSLREKVKYAIDKNIGGISIEALNYDDYENNLLRTISSANECSKNDNSGIKYDCY